MASLDSQINTSLKALLSIGLVNALLFGAGIAAQSFYGGLSSRFEWTLTIFGQNIFVPVLLAQAVTLVSKKSFSKALSLGVYGFYLLGPTALIVGAIPMPYQGLTALVLPTLWSVYGMSTRLEMTLKQTLAFIGASIGLFLLAVITVLITLS